MRSRIALVVAAVLVVAVGIGGALWWRQREADRDEAAQAAGTTYAKAWTAKDLASVPFADDATKSTFSPRSRTSATRRSRSPRGTSSATATPRRARSTSPGRCPVGCRGRMPCRSPSSGRGRLAGRDHDDRLALGHPDLPAGKTLQLERTFGQRGDLLDRDGKPLMPLGTVHAVQIDPVNATPQSAAALEPIVGATKRSLTQALASASASGSKAPIPVISYRDSDWAPRQDRIEGAHGRHRPDVRAAAGPDAYLRPAPARQLRRGDRRDDHGQRRPLPGG